MPAYVVVRHGAAMMAAQLAPVYRPPDKPKKRPERANVRPLFKTISCKPNVIKLPKRAQSELERLKRRLVEGYWNGTVRAVFVWRCFRDFPELVTA